MRVIKKEGLNYYNAKDVGLDEDTFSILYGGGETDIPVEVLNKYPHLFSIVGETVKPKKVKE